MARELSDWLSAYLKYTEETEPPISYHTWVGISLIASALQRKVYLPWGVDEKIYPNQYIVLIGDTGKCRKGVAIGIGQRLIKQIGIPVTSESITRQALIKDMSESVQDYHDPATNMYTFHCSLMCISEEFGVFLGQNDTRFLLDLTDWYNCKDKWEYASIGRGRDSIEAVCFNILGGTAASWIPLCIPPQAIGGGFTARIVFVVENEKRKTINYDVEGDPALWKKLVHDLEQINMMAGPMEFTSEAKDQFYEWYKQQDEASNAGTPPVADPRFAGYCERRGTHIRKLCMALSASRASGRQVNATDFQRACKLLEAVEVNMGQAFGGLGTARYSEATEHILEYISKRKTVSRSELLRKFYRDIDMSVLKIAEEVLTNMKLIQMRIDTVSNEVWYQYKDTSK